MNEAKKNRNAEKYSFSSVEADRFLLMFTNADYDEFKEAVRKGDLNQEDLNTILIFANAGKIAAGAALLDPKIPMTSHQIDVFSTLLSTATMAYEYSIGADDGQKETQAPDPSPWSGKAAARRYPSVLGCGEDCCHRSDLYVRFTNQARRSTGVFDQKLSGIKSL